MIMNKIAQKGAAMVEFAIILPFLLMLTVGIIEFSNAMMSLNTLNKLTMDAARYLSLYAKQQSGYTLSTIDLTNGLSITANAQMLITCGKIGTVANPICGSSPSILVPTPVLDTTNTTVAADGTITVKVNYTYPSIFTNIIGTGINLNGISFDSTVQIQAL
jgi:Flp pilus assembly protein TadG